MNKAEQKQEKQEDYNQIRNEMTNAGYVERVYIIPKAKATFWGVLIGILLTALVMVLYRVIYGLQPDFQLNMPVFCIGAVVSLIIHEFIHGLAWSISCKNGWKSIEFSWSFIMPVCHCKETLNRAGYAVGVLMPFLILGVGITLISYVTANMTILTVAAINLIISGGDLLIAFKLFGSKKAKIIDHPTDPGFIAYVKS